MKKLILIAIACLLCFTPADAQKRKKKKVVKPKVEEVVPEKTPEEELFDELLSSTAKVMFIDSTVVDKATFLEKLQLSREMGRISRDGDKTTYTNELANIQVFAKGQGADRSLFSAHKYGEKWDEAVKLSELGSANNDYPFLMTDGITLYFSAEGMGTVGGRDIFRTTYDAEESHFYEPVNMGLPFNSPANDYLLAISDYDNLGWLVSDRHQPNGKVCIYMFEPTLQRQTFDESTDSLQLLSYASLNSIKDTWSFGDHKAAITRKNEMIERTNNKQTDDKIFFVVNDRTVYTSISDFKKQRDAITFRQIVATKRKLEQTRKLLEMQRDAYADTPKNKRESIGRNILQLEDEVNSMEQTIARKEKKLRNSLNK